MLPLAAQRRRAALVALAVGAIALLGASSAHAATYTVTSAADAVHGSCTASTYSRRHVVIAANATDADDTIVLGRGTYKLTLAGTWEDASATGDLDVVDRSVSGPLVLRGASGRTTRITRRPRRPCDQTRRAHPELTVQAAHGLRRPGQR